MVSSALVRLEIKEQVAVVRMQRGKGNALNPAMVEGQSIGGLIQGLGGAFLDHLIYDEEGQLLTTNFADYLVPGSTGLPDITSIMLEDYPSQSNPMGFKGVGEGGITSVAGTVGNAVAQAFRGRGVEITKLPLNPANLHALLSQEGNSA